MIQYETVIGLEVHAQLLTESKIFCSCSTQFGAAPNSQVCPVCLGMPGVLPVTNRKAVEFAVRLGLALHCDIRERSIFARKNYFYPDLPKGYQISQYEEPICENGWIEIEEEGSGRQIRIHRIHLEEDAGKSVHDEHYVARNETLIDLNRCGTPLVEIVSEPDLRSPRDAYVYLHKIRQMVRWLGVCDGNMEEGSLRCDANISLRRAGEKILGVKTELKNMNSIRGVERALAFEVERQRHLLESGKRIIQQTLLWDEAQGKAVPMRGKEDAPDYRYFPDPDLMPVIVPESWKKEIEAGLPELPDARKQRWASELGLSDYEVSVLNEDRGISDYFEALSRLIDPKPAANWVMGEVMRRLNEDKIQIQELKVSPEALARIIRFIQDGTISNTAGKAVFDDVAGSGISPEQSIKKLGLVQVSDEDEIRSLIDRVILNNPDPLKKYLNGKQGLFGFFVGQIMQASQGKANPNVVHKLLKEKLEEAREKQSKT